jgi:hypothetical protein
VSLMWAGSRRNCVLAFARPVRTVSASKWGPKVPGCVQSGIRGGMREGWTIRLMLSSGPRMAWTYCLDSIPYCGPRQLGR